jgi:hypothetical protein
VSTDGGSGDPGLSVVNQNVINGFNALTDWLIPAGAPGTPFVPIPLQQGGIIPPGAITPATLHGPEAVIPLSQGRLSVDMPELLQEMKQMREEVKQLRREITEKPPHQTRLNVFGASMDTVIDETFTALRTGSENDEHWVYLDKDSQRGRLIIGRR